jgi:hypothetical protein
VLLFCSLGESGAVDIPSLCVLHLRASVALFVYNGAICYIDVARNRDESGCARVRLSISRCSSVIAFRNLVGVYHSMARRCLFLRPVSGFESMPHTSESLCLVQKPSFLSNCQGIIYRSQLVF